MNNRIEKFLVYACFAQAFAWIAARLIPGIASYFMLHDVEAGSSIIYSSTYLITIFSMLSYIPLQLVCAVWLKKESERIAVNHRVWFWTGFLFKFIGVIVFYVYLIYSRKQKVEPAGGGNG